MGARIAVNRLKRSDLGLLGLNFTIGLSGERRASATAHSMLDSKADVNALSDMPKRSDSAAILVECRACDLRIALIAVKANAGFSDFPTQLRTAPSRALRLLCAGLPHRRSANLLFRIFNEFLDAPGKVLTGERLGHHMHTWVEVAMVENSVLGEAGDK